MIPSAPMLFALFRTGQMVHMIWKHPRRNLIGGVLILAGELV